MDERGIIIADRDERYRKEMADFFEKAGYAVETTDSAVHVLCSVLEKQTPVLLLGSDFDKKVSSTELIHLLKKCNRHLNVIMISDQLPLAEARRVRQAGIFYHAFKPASAGDTEEIGQAVRCAFDNREAHMAVKEQPRPAPGEELPPVAEKELPPCGSPVCSFDTERAEDRGPAGSGWLIVILVLMVLVASSLSWVAAEQARAGNGTAIWLFLGFCALIVITQLLPIFQIKLPFRPNVPEKEPTDGPEK
jgi:DNA-binding NarL/FixJ family response regulator